MRLTPSLFHKAILLVALPFLFEVIVVSYLLYLLSVTEQEIAREQLGKKILIQANVLTTCANQAAKWKVMSLEQGFGSSGQFDHKVSEALAPLPKAFERLKELVGGNKTWLAHVKSCEYRSNRVIYLMNKSHDAGANGYTLQVLQIMGALRRELDRLEDAQSRLIADAREIERESSESLGQQRATLKVMLVAFLAVGALLALGLATYFHKGTMSRLLILLSNVRLFKDEKPLHPELSGNDEIAVLDKAFHEMANTVIESASRERAIIRNAKEVICSLNSDLDFVRVNPACQTVWSYSPEELSGRSLFSIVPQNEEGRIRAAISDLKKTPDGGSFESKVRTQSGELIDMLWSVSWSESDKSLFCVCHDVSEQKKIEQLKRDFVAMISHDLRTPLTSIKMMMDLMNTGMLGVLPEQAKDAVGRATKNCDYLIALINQLLEIEKLETGNIQLLKEDILIEDVFAQTKTALTVLAERAGLQLVLGESEGVLISADKQRITQVLMNLVSNAIKFSPRDSEIIMKSSLEKDATLKVWVIDHGRGIPKDAIAKVFDRFQQVERADETVKGGSGLGLAICKAIVEAHHGEIGVDSEEGKGSCFWFKLPLNSNDA
ncbi:MAG: PAS domain-containing sensor histidine kinase [Candidatus Obscuribacterales bacterium]|nr:PAS domain-containing sensor histidine kinase [Candidatus Obscuribacterales bacterium]